MLQRSVGKDGKKVTYSVTVRSQDGCSVLFRDKGLSWASALAKSVALKGRYPLSSITVEPDDGDDTEG